MVCAAGVACEGHWGRGRRVSYPDGGIIMDAIVISGVGMQWFSMAIPRVKILRSQSHARALSPCDCDLRILQRNQ